MLINQQQTLFGGRHQVATTILQEVTRPHLPRLLFFLLQIIIKRSVGEVLLPRGRWMEIVQSRVIGKRRVIRSSRKQTLPAFLRDRWRGNRTSSSALSPGRIPFGHFKRVVVRVECHFGHRDLSSGFESRNIGAVFGVKVYGRNRVELSQRFTHSSSQDLPNGLFVFKLDFRFRRMDIDVYF